VTISSAFTGDLKDAIAKYDHCAKLAAEAREDEQSASEGVRDAKDADIDADVQAILAGGDGSDERSEPEANRALEWAVRHAMACERARLVALGKVADECRDPKHAERIAKQEADLTKTALKFLENLERVLVEIAEKRALAKWLADPSDGERLREPRQFDVWVGAQRLRAPNGDAARSKDLTVGLREALLGNDRAPENPAASYGVPVGTRLSGPWGVVPTIQDERAGITFTEGQARAFEEALTGGDE